MRLLLINAEEYVSKYLQKYFNNRNIYVTSVNLNYFNEKTILHEVINYEYVVYIKTKKFKKRKIIGKAKEYDFLKKLFFISEKFSKKALFVFPYRQETAEKKLTEQFIRKFKVYKPKNSKILFLGELLQPLSSVSNINLSIFQKRKNRSLLYSTKFKNPIYIKNFADELMRSMLSLKSYGRSRLLISKSIETEEILSHLGKGGKRYLSKTRLFEINKKFVDDKKTFRSQKEKFLKVIYDSVEKEKFYIRENKLKVFFYEIFDAISLLIKFSLTIVFIYFILLPLFFITIKTGVVFTTSMLNTSKAVGFYGKGISDFSVLDLYLNTNHEILSNFEFPKGNIDNIKEYSNILTRIGKFQSANKSLIYKVNNFGGCYFNNSCSENNIDILETVYLDLKALYEDELLLSADLKQTDNPLVNYTLSKYFVNKINFLIGEHKHYLDFLSFRRELFAYGDRELTYAVVYYNPDYLTSFGGKTLKIGLLKLKNGSVYDYKEYYPTEILENIKGFLDLTNVVGDKLTEDNITFDNIVGEAVLKGTSENIIWLIDKSVDIQVDGVIYLNVYSYDELKDDYINKRFSLNKFDKILLRSEVNKVTAYHKDEKVFDLLADRGLARVNVENTCENKNCFFDFAYPYETAISGTHSADIERKATLKISFEKDLIKKELVYFVSNKGDGKYFANISLMVPHNSGFSRVKFVGTKGDEEIKSNNLTNSFGKVVESEITLLGNETGALVFSWEQLFPENTKDYKFSFLKQNSMMRYPLTFTNINLNYPEFTMENNFVLTAANTYQYNTILSGDINFEIMFK